MLAKFAFGVRQVKLTFDVRHFFRERISERLAIARGRDACHIKSLPIDAAISHSLVSPS